MNKGNGESGPKGIVFESPSLKREAEDHIKREDRNREIAEAEGLGINPNYTSTPKNPNVDRVIPEEPFSEE